MTHNSVVVATLFGSHAGTVFLRDTVLSRLDIVLKMLFIVLNMIQKCAQTHCNRGLFQPTDKIRK